MARPAPDSTQYFLGVNGEQTGPFSEDEVRDQIQAGTIPPDALVWYEGLSDWQAVNTIEYFKDAFSGDDSSDTSAGKPLPSVGGGFKPLSEDSIQESVPSRQEEYPRPMIGKKRTSDGGASFAADDEPAPIFDDGFGAPPPNKKRALILLGLMIGAGAIGGAYFFLGESGNEATFVAPIPNRPAPESAPEGREALARRALSELLLKPDDSTRILRRVITENPDDAIGKEALAALIDFFKTRQRTVEAGRLLMDVKKPQEAAKFFLMEPASPQDAEAALFAAYQQSQDPARREWLIQSIRLALGTANNPAGAIERIKILEKDFPKERHPFGYYLKTTDAKITDLFQRLSFHFVQSLLGFLNTELPQISFVSRPLVEVRKDKKGTYRVVGSYKGEVTLNQDRLKGINFTFWWNNEAWSVVETNLTEERQSFSRQEKKRLENAALPAAKMLEVLESTFQTLFPKNALHEAVGAKSEKKSGDI